MYKKILAFAVMLSASCAQLVHQQYVNDKLQLAFAPLARLSSTVSNAPILKETDPHLTECLEAFQENAIEQLAADAFAGIACVENRLDDIQEEITALGEKVNETLLGLLPELEDHVNIVLEKILMHDLPGAVAAVRAMVGFLLGTGGDVLADVGAFVNEVVEIIDEEQAETCLLGAFETGVTHLNVALEELDTCINTPPKRS